MQLTSLEKAKACYDAGIRFVTEYYTAKGCIKIETGIVQKLIFDKRLKEGEAFPAPTLDEWLDWLPKKIKISDHILTFGLEIEFNKDGMFCIAYQFLFPGCRV